MYKKAKVFDDVFSLEEINELRIDQTKRPISNPIAATNNYDRNLDYHLPESVAHKIIKPKIDLLIGPDHEFSTGSYKDVWTPYGAHVDNHVFQSKFYNFSANNSYHIAILIPLAHDPEFKTVLFDVYSDEDLGIGDVLPEKYLTGKNDLDLNLFTHVDEKARQQMSKLSLDFIWPWKLGSMIVWPRTQLHSSTDFSKYGLCKKFVIIFLA